MRFRILGPLEVWDDDEQPVALSRRLHRSTLSLLLLNAGQPCSINSLVAALWPDTPPLSPEVSLRSCIYGIRKLLPDGGRVRTHPSGYLITVQPGELDLLSFRELVTSGRDALDSGSPLDASKLLAEAIELWRDPPLADLPEVREKDKLLDQRREAQDALIDADLALGRHRQVLPELRSVVTADPLREHAWAQLMLALYRCGARAEALAAFGRLRMTLVTTYGIEPGPELQELHRQVLADDPVLMPRGGTELVTATSTPGVTPIVTAAATGLVPARYPVTPTWQPDHSPLGNGQLTSGQVRNGQLTDSQAGNSQAGNGQAGNGQAGNGAIVPAGGGPAMMAAPVPVTAPVPAAAPALAAAPASATAPLSRPACQLPAAVADFTGRSTEVAELLDRLPSDHHMAVTVLSGMPGAGKTALAVHAAHLAKARFPDGQLCAWLDDCGLARDPQVVLGELLRGLGFPAGEIPVSRFEREAMYRSALAERKVLILIDGASSAAQVRPLLPSTAGSAVIVTSRSRLADIDGAKTIELGGMLPADAVTLLAKISGRDLADANPEPGNPEPGNPRPGNPRPGNRRSADAGPGNPGPGNRRSADAGPGNPGPASLGPASLGPASLGPASLGPVDQTPGNRRSADAGPGNPGPASLGPASLGPVDQTPGNRRSADAGPGYPGPASLGSASLGSASLGSASLGSASLGSVDQGPGNPRSASAASALSIAASCGYLPLALRIAGARLADEPDLPVARLASLLANETRRLDELALGDQSVRSRLAMATQALSGPARTVLALLAAAGPRDAPGWLIASLLEEPAASLVAPALANAGLLHRVPGVPTADGNRGTIYRMHPLVRAYAGELLANANPGVVGAATGRLLASGWLELANGGENTALDHRQRTPIRPS